MDKYRCEESPLLCSQILRLSRKLDLKRSFIPNRTHKNYFDKLRKDTEILHQSSDPQLAVNHLVNGLIKGIIMHKELLRILKEIDKAFGTVVALQLCQSPGGAVSLLLGIAVRHPYSRNLSSTVVGIHAPCKIHVARIFDISYCMHVFRHNDRLL
ncbi:unnamed protein product [Danaus chrysippus]|uniref:(African queen) hypothetical protein n=1 Tax=Danaus chrysippus TaxID=151541 RepID=A0A8J2VUM1_9NEOP|nr:unnamed protein product [Danaus chrysippus]